MNTDDRCLTHARIAVKQAVMKGLDREILADAFMLEAVKLAFGVDDREAAKAAQRWKETTLRMLDADFVTHSGPNGEPRLVRLLLTGSRETLLGSSALVRSA